MRYSVLIPIIKGKFLQKAIDSVLDQDFSDFELILYNDCSQDDIDKIIKLYSDSKIRYYKGDKNIGAEDPSVTWNKMLEMAKGEYIILLGDDDLIDKNYLSKMNDLILKYPDVSLFRSKLKRINENDNILSVVEELPKFEAWDQALYERMVNKREQSTSEFVIKKSELVKVGGYLSFPRACGSDDATYLKLMKGNGIISTNDVSAYWRKSDLNISDNDSAEVNEYKIRFLLEWEKAFLDKEFSKSVPLSALYKSIDDYLNLAQNQKREHELNITTQQLTSTKDQLISTQQQLTSTKDQLISTQQQLTSTKDQLISTQQQLTSTKDQLISTQQQLIVKQSQLKCLYNSREYEIGLKVQKIFKISFPVGSLRRKFLIECVNRTKKCKRLFKKIKTFTYIFAKSTYYKLKLKRDRQINKNAKKLAYIGHSYHNKTKSTIFLQEYLKKFFDVEIISDNSWKGEVYPDLSFVNREDYVGVLFFQLLPSDEILNNIDNDNIIFCPMYDQSGRLDFNYWDKYRNLKIINFSKTLHKKLKKWGFESMHVQYFPKVKGFFHGKKDEIFFWQRLTQINIKTILKVLDSENLKIHLHKAIDPNHEFIKPTKNQEKKYNITYSKWFDTREEMQEIIKQKGIYIAPREYEGIGQSFLEAMSMGKAVIAVNNPTMSEYIEHNKTGYLFDLDNPQKINLDNIAQIQKNTYGYMVNGRKKWKKDRKKIIEFIKKA